MTWSPNATFAALLDDQQRDELYAVEISGHGTVFTTGPVSSASWTYVQSLGDIEIEAGKVDIARGSWELGTMNFNLENRDGSAAALASIADLAGRTVTLWMGFRGLAQANWEKVGTYTIEKASIEEYGAYAFECIEPFPELGRALASSLETGLHATITRPVNFGATRIYIDDRTDFALGMTVAIYDGYRYMIRTISAIGYETVSGDAQSYIDVPAADQFISVNGTVARCLSIAGNPVNIAVRILVDDFATVGSIQTDFPITAAYGAWTAGDGFGVPLARLDVAAIKAERDARMSTLVGQVIFEQLQDDGRGWLDDLCHGVMQLVARRNGLLSIRSCLLPSAAGTPPTIDDTNARDWAWQRSFSDAYNRVIVEGDLLGRETKQLALVEDAGSIAAIGRRELVVRSPWLRSALSGETSAMIIGGRLLARTTSGVENLACVASVGRSVVEAGDPVLLTHPYMPDTGAGGVPMSGAVAEVAAAALSLPDNGIHLETRRYSYARGAAIAPDSQVDFGSATSLEKSLYAFITEDSGLMPDGSAGYTWV